MKKHFFFLLISLIAAGILCQFYGYQWEEYVRDGLYAIKGISVTDYAKESVDENGVPYVYYREQNNITAGNQYNATIVCNYALAYFDTLEKTNDKATEQRFLNCVDWLSTNMTRTDGYAYYTFRWQQPWYPKVGAPYTSGMTSGRAIEVFTNAYAHFKSPKYLSYCSMLVSGFYQPIDSGGFTYKEPYGWWYEEIADRNKETPKILDGHIFALMGVYKLYKETQSDSAKYIFDQGLKALKHQLPKYNIGNGKIYYDKYGKVADKKYHRILTGQMNELFQITGDAVFKNYYNKWNGFLQQPYVLRILKEKNISGIILFILVAFVCWLLIYVIQLVYISNQRKSFHKTIDLNSP